MKNGRFETQAEIYQALLDGKKIKRETWNPQAYIHLVGGALRDELGIDVSETRLNPPHEFLIYEEPKPKKKVTLYRYTYERSRSVVDQSVWTNLDWNTYKEFNLPPAKLLLTETKEIEVDDVN